MLGKLSALVGFRVVVTSVSEGPGFLIAWADLDGHLVHYVLRLARMLGTRQITLIIFIQHLPLLWVLGIQWRIVKDD